MSVKTLRIIERKPKDYPLADYKEIIKKHVQKGLFDNTILGISLLFMNNDKLDPSIDYYDEGDKAKADLTNIIMSIRNLPKSIIERIETTTCLIRLKSHGKICLAGYSEKDNSIIYFNPLKKRYEKLKLCLDKNNSECQDSYTIASIILSGLNNLFKYKVELNYSPLLNISMKLERIPTILVSDYDKAYIYHDNIDQLQFNENTSYQPQTLISAIRYNPEEMTENHKEALQQVKDYLLSKTPPIQRKILEYMGVDKMSIEELSEINSITSSGNIYSVLNFEYDIRKYPSLAKIRDISAFMNIYLYDKEVLEALIKHYGLVPVKLENVIYRVNARKLSYTTTNIDHVIEFLNNVRANSFKIITSIKTDVAEIFHKIDATRCDPNKLAPFLKLYDKILKENIGRIIYFNYITSFSGAYRPVVMISHNNPFKTPLMLILGADVMNSINELIGFYNKIIGKKQLKLTDYLSKQNTS